MTDLAIGMKIIPTLALRQERLLAITPELRQAIGLLQMGAHELSRFIQEQGQENPFLQVSQGDTVATASSHDSPSSAVTRHGVQPAFPPDTRAIHPFLVTAAAGMPVRGKAAFSESVVFSRPG